MFQIRQEQLAALERAAARAYERLLGDYVVEHHADAIADLSDTAVAATIRRGVQRAYTYGFVSSETMTTFVTLLFEIGPAFDRQPFIRAILEDATIPPDLRFEVLEECTTEAHWIEAAELTE